MGRFYRLLLRAYPRAFREEFGRDMEAAFEACLARERAARPRLGTVRAIAAAVIDTFVQASRARREQRREHRHRQRQVALSLHDINPQDQRLRMTQIIQDAKFALRALAKDRSFTATVLLTLAICIGANAAIFAVVQSVILRPLPVPEADRLVNVFNSYPNAGVPRASNAVPDYYDRLRDLTVFEEQALFRWGGATIGFDGGSERVAMMMATPSLFRVLRVSPQLGAAFTEDDGVVGNHRKVLLSHGMWQSRFAGRPDVVGTDLRVNGRPYTIAGVMPPDFHFIRPDIRIWIPLAFAPEDKTDDRRHSNNHHMIGRLKPDATIEQAQQQLDAINRRNNERFPQFRQILADAGFRTLALPFQADLVREIRPVLYLLWGGVLFVLLIGAVNITNLVIVRSSARHRDLATRHAIGAGLRRLASQLIAETMLLAAAGGALGLALGWWALSLVPALGLDEIPRGHEIRMDPMTAGTVLAASALVGLLIGFVPVMRLRRLNLNVALREEGRSGTASRRAMFARRMLATAQVGFAFLLLLGAALLVASFRHVLGVDPGFVPEGVVSGSVSLPTARYPDGAAARSYGQRALERIRALPGIENAALTDTVPFGGAFSDSVIIPEGYVAKPGESLISPTEIDVSDGYFETMRIPLVAGRYLDTRDTLQSQRVIVIDRKLAHRFWPDQDPIGKRVYTPGNNEELTKPGPDSRWFTVAGVVEDVKMYGLADEDRRVGAYYFPHAQREVWSFAIVARSTLPADSVASAVRTELAAIDPEVPLFSVRTLPELMDESLVSRRMPMLLGVTFGVVALLLSAIGIYGVLAYQVAQRRREIGIRMALGSSVRGVFALVLADGARIVGIGLALGLAGAFATAAYIESQLFGVRALDPMVMAAVALVLAVVSFVAVSIPARRAANVNPVIALAGE